MQFSSEFMFPGNIDAMFPGNIDVMFPGNINSEGNCNYYCMSREIISTNHVAVFYVEMKQIIMCIYSTVISIFPTTGNFEFSERLVER